MNIIRYLDVTVWTMMLIEAIGSGLVLYWWPRLNRSGRLVGGWLVVATIFAVGGFLGKVLLQNSLIVTFFWFPCSAILAFNALASMHAPGRSRISLRVLSWCVVAAWVVLALVVESPGDYSRLTSPMHAVLLAAASAYTLITRVESSRADLLRDSSFVVAAFWVIYAVPTVFLSVAARYWMAAKDTQTLLNYYSFRNTIVVLAYPILIYGIWLFVDSRRETQPQPVSAAG